MYCIRARGDILSENSIVHSFVSGQRTIRNRKPSILSSLLTAAGILSTAMGMLGIFLPLLPTTPFLLLAAFCFMRSSPRLHAWLLGNRWVGQYIRDYVERGGMRQTVKIRTLVLLWTVIGATVVWGVDAMVIRLLLLAIATGVTVHIASIRTVS